MKCKQKSTKKLLWILAVLCAAALCLAACGQTSAEAEPTETTVAATEESGMLEVVTSYCTMQYPSSWEELLEVQETEYDSILEELFCCNVDGRQYQLFAVRFGEGALGDIIGYLPHQDQKVPVSLEVFEFAGDSELMEEDEQTVFAMQEAVNDVIQSIMAIEGYSAQ